MTAGLLAWLVARADRAAFLDLLSGAHVGWLLIAAALIPLQVLLCAARWRRMAVDLGLPLPRRVAVREYALSIFLNQVLPGGMTGDAIRVWRHRAGHGSVGAPLRAAIAERATGQVAHLLLTLAGLLLWSELHGGSAPPGAIGLVTALLGIAALALALPGRLPGLGQTASDARIALGTPDRLAFHAVTSGLLLVTFIGGFAASAAAIGQPLGWGLLTAIPLVLLAMAIPLSVGGWGLREVSATAVLAFLGWAPEEALALSAVYGLSVLIGALPGALVLLIRASEPASV